MLLLFCSIRYLQFVLNKLTKLLVFFLELWDIEVVYGRPSIHENFFQNNLKKKKERVKNYDKNVEKRNNSSKINKLK